MTTIYLLRHGQSEGNKEHIIQGQSDFALTAAGKKQAELAASSLQDVHFDAVYSSDLTRAFATGQAVSEKKNMPLEASPLLREVFLGPLEGRTRKELIEMYPELEHKSIVTSGIPGTENFDDLTERCQTLVNSWLEKHSGATIAALSHGGFISILLMYMIAGDMWHQLNRPFLIHNTGITKVFIDEMGQAKFHYVNNTAHLDHES
ncbi:histidine phosphatase family protein [Alkalicoccus chagannorensis]|uniref:histidine phosphatase family protein n=1 Tax=Alkalicoccus chagannorensis TaxID=427072 RepID=UPI000421A56D|nr:histidine phosphatase family protein [Alkalicoccus chagannorensis]